MNRALKVVFASSFAAVLASSASAAVIPLTDATPGSSDVYSYSLGNNGPADSNATRLGAMYSAAGGYTGSNYQSNNQPFQVQYTFELAPQANKLQLTGANLVVSGGENYQATDGVQFTYALSGGSTTPTSGELGYWHTSLDATGTDSGTTIPFDVNLSLTPSASPTTVTITFTQQHLFAWQPAGQGYMAGEGWRQVILKNSQPFVATATFVPEPTSIIGLMAAGSLLTLRRRRA